LERKKAKETQLENYKVLLSQAVGILKDNKKIYEEEERISLLNKELEDA
jgi:hypothetical protein